MINWAEMEEQRTEGLPILSDVGVKEDLISTIEYVRERAEKRVRVGNPDSKSIKLFSFTAEEYSLFGRIWGYLGAGKVGSANLQKLGLEVMKEYGLDEEVSHSGPASRDYLEWGKEGVGTFKNADGTLGRVWLYPSQKTPGLVFERVEKICPTTMRATSVDWNVRDMAPNFRINLGKKY